MSTGVTTTTEAGGSFAISYTLTSAHRRRGAHRRVRRHERSHCRAPRNSSSTPRRGTSPKPSPSPAWMTTWPTALSRSASRRASPAADAVYDDFVVAVIDAVNQDDDSAGICRVRRRHDHDRGRRQLRHQLHLDQRAHRRRGALPSRPTTRTRPPSPAQHHLRRRAWTSRESVTVTGADDDVADGAVAFGVTTSVASVDPVYAGITVDDIDAVNQDDDSAGIVVSTGVTATTEAGGSFAISYTLTSGPPPPWCSPSRPATRAKPLSRAQLIFNAETWDQPQAVTVTSGRRRGRRRCRVQHHDQCRQRRRFLRRRHRARHRRRQSGRRLRRHRRHHRRHHHHRSGRQLRRQLHLDQRPPPPWSSPSLRTTRAKPRSPPTPQLTFDAETWDQPQSVTVTGADDDVADGDVAFAETTSVASEDPVYAGFVAAVIDAVNQDDDSAGIVVSTERHHHDRSGRQLRRQLHTHERTHRRRGPHRRVGRHERGHRRSQLTFDAETWDQSQSVTVTGADDDVVDGDVAFGVTTSVASGCGLRWLCRG
ncbi:MAG: hypothetical protein R2854_26360 [Caldilineaceae bacterium]